MSATAADRRVLLVERDGANRDRIASLLVAADVAVDPREGLSKTPGGGYALVAANYDQLSAEERETLVREFGGGRGGTRLLLFSEGGARKDFPLLFGERALTNLVARNHQDVDGRELVVTVRKILDRDIFGIEKYFAPSSAVSRSLLKASTEKERAIELAREFAEGHRVHPRLIGVLCTVTDELVTNAIYNAPVDRDGKSRFSHFARTQEVRLDAGEDVALALCYDGERVGISVSDPFGSLTQERLLEYLARCFRRGEDQVEQKAGGAGLGLFFIFENLSQFVVNICPGRRTEMIGLIGTRGGYREYASRNKSFNVFVTDRT